jgi:hypothetical protein
MFAYLLASSILLCVSARRLVRRNTIYEPCVSDPDVFIPLSPRLYLTPLSDYEDYLQSELQPVMPATYSPEIGATGTSQDDDILFGPTPAWLLAVPTPAQNFLVCEITSYRAELAAQAAASSSFTSTPSFETVTMISVSLSLSTDTTTFTTMEPTQISSTTDIPQVSVLVMTQTSPTTNATHAAADLASKSNKASSNLTPGTKILVGVTIPLAAIALVAGVAVYLVGKSRGRVKRAKFEAKSGCAYGCVDGHGKEIACVGIGVVEARGNRSPVELPVARHCMHCP